MAHQSYHQAQYQAQIALFLHSGVAEQLESAERGFSEGLMRAAAGYPLPGGPLDVVVMVPAAIGASQGAA